jgi:hypothetical protein
MRVSAHYACAAGQSCRNCPISHESLFPFFCGIAREATLEIEQMSIFEEVRNGGGEFSSAGGRGPALAHIL